MTSSAGRVVTEPIDARARASSADISDPLATADSSTPLGRYRLQELVGQGGMSFVYAATHVTLGNRVAIKVLRPKFVDREQVVNRFLREAQAAALVPHPHIVAIRDFGISSGGQVFSVMEYLPGESLASTVEREGPLAWRRARHFMLQICAALEAVHRAGIVHRDVTLGNVFRMQRDSDPDFVKLVDFGIARMMVTEQSDPSAPRLTSEAEVFGTPAFMAPEQVRRTCDADPRSDVYSAGVILFALLTGRPPFQGASAMQVLQKQVHEPAPSARRFVDSIPPAVDELIARALEKDPDRRFQSADALGAAIAAIPADLATPPRPTVRRSGWPLVLCAAALLLAFWLAFS